MIFIDAVNVKIRDGNVANRPVYVALTVTVEGTRDGAVALREAGTGEIGDPWVGQIARVTADNHTYKPHSSDAFHAASTRRAICSGLGGRGWGRFLAGGLTDDIGLKEIQPQRTAALSAPLRIGWIWHTLDAAYGWHT